MSCRLAARLRISWAVLGYRPGQADGGAVARMDFTQQQAPTGNGGGRSLILFNQPNGLLVETCGPQIVTVSRQDWLSRGRAGPLSIASRKSRRTLVAGPCHFSALACLASSSRWSVSISSHRDSNASPSVW